MDPSTSSASSSSSSATGKPRNRFLKQYQAHRMAEAANSNNAELAALQQRVLDAEWTPPEKVSAGNVGKRDTVHFAPPVDPGRAREFVTAAAPTLPRVPGQNWVVLRHTDDVDGGAAPQPAPAEDPASEKAQKLQRKLKALQEVAAARRAGSKRVPPPNANKNGASGPKGSAAASTAAAHPTLFSVMGVFETEEIAQEYAEFLSEVLKDEPFVYVVGKMYEFHEWPPTLNNVSSVHTPNRDLTEIMEGYLKRREESNLGFRARMREAGIRVNNQAPPEAGESAQAPASSEGNAE